MSRSRTNFIKMDLVFTNPEANAFIILKSKVVGAWDYSTAKVLKSL